MAAGWSERRIIEEVLAPLAADAPGAFGLTDDAAVIRAEPGTEHVVTLDTLIEGVHFRSADPARFVAKKALRVNISDLAAKGAEPFAWFLALGLPPARDGAWLADFAKGLAEDQERYGVLLHGGDTVRSPDRIVLSVTMLGRCAAGRSVRRFGARPGDAVYVSGTIGDAALGLLTGVGEGPVELADADAMFLARRFLLPEPRTRLSAALRVHANAAMDISDGLYSDLGLLCGASGVGAEVAIERVPLSDAAKRALAADRALLANVIAGGDDFEILAAIDQQRTRAFERDATEAGVRVTRIGRIVEGAAPPRFVDERGRVKDFSSAVFSHF
jgi:thiamine-monophosphate kinase